jgi:hypothetical protein
MRFTTSLMHFPRLRCVTTCSSAPSRTESTRSSWCCTASSRSSTCLVRRRSPLVIAPRAARHPIPPPPLLPLLASIVAGDTSKVNKQSIAFLNTLVDRPLTLLDADSIPADGSVDMSPLVDTVVAAVRAVRAKHAAAGGAPLLYPPSVLVVSRDGKNRGAAVAAAALLHLEPFCDSALRAARAVINARGRVLDNVQSRWQLVAHAVRAGKLLPKDITLESVMSKLATLVTMAMGCRSLLACLLACLLAWLVVYEADVGASFPSHRVLCGLCSVCHCRILVFLHSSPPFPSSMNKPPLTATTRTRWHHWCPPSSWRRSWSWPPVVCEWVYCMKAC